MSAHSNKVSYTVPDSMNFNNSTSYALYHVSDSMTFSFDDGTTYTGEELKSFMKVMKQLIEEKYPEELI